MAEFFGMNELKETVQAIREYTDLEPKVGMILGSGLNALADAIENPIILPFDQLPHFPTSTVQGHQGRLVMGMLEGVPVIVMQGRAHYYEGYSMPRIGLPIRVMKLLGVETMIITNAAGGLNMTYSAGDVMILRDHINLIGMAGLNPLRGPNIEEFGPRFPDMSAVYDPDLRKIAEKLALENQVPCHQGVYICLAGPSFETPSDVRFLRVIGADAVGMSTVPEAITAKHAGMRVLGFSGISNTLFGEPGAPPTDHEEVLEAGKLLVPRLETIIRGVLRTL